MGIGSSATNARPLPGRLGDPAMSLATDPRTHPGVLKALGPLGLDTNKLELPPVSHVSPLEEKLKWVNDCEVAFGSTWDTLIATWPAIAGVASYTEVIKGVDDNDITLYISKPSASSCKMPCMLHLHGGCMSFLSAADKLATYWREAVASTGMIVIGVEFRNCGGRLGPHPFPAGLNDCMSALEWANENRRLIGYSKLIISGDSGGANLSIAVALKAKREDKCKLFQGVYALHPYIYGDWSTRCSSLPSQLELDGYFLGMDFLGVLAPIYDPSGQNSKNPLAWPYYATEEDLAGLPSIVISVNELDPLRDEGLAFYRKLTKVGVIATARIMPGLPHSGDMLLFASAPEVCWSTLRDIHSFAQSLHDVAD